VNSLVYTLSIVNSLNYITSQATLNAMYINQQIVGQQLQ
jgi:hypothetical protein